MSDDQQHELLTTEELADLLRSTRTAINTMRSRGEPPATLGFKRGRRVLYRRSDIEAWIDAQAAAQRSRINE